MQSSINNIYQLEGRIPVAKAIPFGLQHILAMFVSNLTPITLIAASAQPALTQAQIAILLQNAMFVAGIATLIQLYPIWKIGSRLPVVMGVSFTFVTVLSTVAANYGYPAVIGAVMIGGIMEGTLGLLAKYWRKIITPVVAASVSSGLDREITGKEISGSLACDGYASTISSLFGCPPVTSFSQNVGLVAMTKVVNRFTIMTGAVCMILAGLLPPIGNFFASLPDSVVGGCTIMMFGSILTSGVQMIASCGFSQRNITIVSLSLAVGIGFTTASESGIWDIFPSIIQSVFAENVVAVVFIISIVLSCILPENMDIEKIKE